MWSRLKRMFTRDEPSPNFPIWNEVKDKKFFQSKHTFEKHISTVDAYIQKGGVEIPTAVLQCGQHKDMFPSLRRDKVESLLVDSEAALFILRSYIHLLPDYTPIGGKWVDEKVNKGKFTRMWNFIISPTVKEIRRVYQAGNPMDKL